MKLSQGMFAWNPGTSEVRAGPWPDTTGWTETYQMTGGGCWEFVRRLPSEQAKAHLYIQAMHLIVRDGVEPAAVHRAFQAFDEYVDALADDMPRLADSD